MQGLGFTKRVAKVLVGFLSDLLSVIVGDVLVMSFEVVWLSLGLVHGFVPNTLSHHESCDDKCCMPPVSGACTATVSKGVGCCLSTS
jgi:hypothetical protein